MAGRSRALPIIGGLGVLGGGYYLYTAGGNTKVAKKQVERESDCGESQDDWAETPFQRMHKKQQRD